MKEKKKSKLRAEYEKINSFKLFSPYCPWTYPSNWWKNIKWFFRSFKYAAQRVRQGYCDLDLMDLDSYFVGLMACALEEFAEKSEGYPCRYISRYYSEDQDSAAWKAEVRGVSLHLFQSLDCLEDFNYNKMKFPGKLVFKKDEKEQTYATVECSDIEKLNKLHEEEKLIYEDRQYCYRKAMEWLTEYGWDLWW